jgi:hypothetical protein
MRDLRPVNWVGNLITLITFETRGVSHCGLAIYIKKYLKDKEEL